MTDVDRKTKNIVVRCLRPYKGYGLLRERENEVRENQENGLINMISTGIMFSRMGGGAMVRSIQCMRVGRQLFNQFSLSWWDGNGLINPVYFE